MIAEENERKRLEQLKLQLEQLVDTSETFRQFKDQIIIDITPSGLRIQIVDKDKRPMFDSGSHELKAYSRQILYGLADVLKKVPNKLSITGHTDATPFDLGNYGNWELSSDRANAARRALIRGGITPDKIARVEGFADSVLFDKEHPTNPINRRIAIIVLKQNVSDAIESEATGNTLSF
jgi:chemotaxis protein MotB